MHFQGFHPINVIRPTLCELDLQLLEMKAYIHIVSGKSVMLTHN
jgi:hypothetical protein